MVAGSFDEGKHQLWSKYEDAGSGFAAVGPPVKTPRSPTHTPYELTTDFARFKPACSVLDMLKDHLDRTLNQTLAI